MTSWTAIDNTEVAAGQPAFASVARRQRDNLTALAEGDATVPEASKLTVGSFKKPTSAAYTAELAHIEDRGLTGTYTSGSCIVIVPGEYRLSGTITKSGGSAPTLETYVNDVVVETGTGNGSYNHDLTLASGDRVHYVITGAGGAFTISATNFSFSAEIYVPLAQCNFE